MRITADNFAINNTENLCDTPEGMYLCIIKDEGGHISHIILERWCGVFVIEKESMGEILAFSLLEDVQDIIHSLELQEGNE